MSAVGWSSQHLPSWSLLIFFIFFIIFILRVILWRLRGFWGFGRIRRKWVLGLASETGHSSQHWLSEVGSQDRVDPQDWILDRSQIYRGGTTCTSYGFCICCSRRFGIFLILVLASIMFRSLEKPIKSVFSKWTYSIGKFNLCPIRCLGSVKVQVIFCHSLHHHSNRFRRVSWNRFYHFPVLYFDALKMTNRWMTFRMKINNFLPDVNQILFAVEPVLWTLYLEDGN